MVQRRDGRPATDRGNHRELNAMDVRLLTDQELEREFLAALASLNDAEFCAVQTVLESISFSASTEGLRLWPPSADGKAS